MAILPDCPGIKVEVVVDGTALTEYDDTENGTHLEATASTVKYVEATTGANFLVRVSIDPGFKTLWDVRTVVKIDGNKATGNITRSDILAAGRIYAFQGATDRV